MQAALRSAAVDAVRSASTALALWAIPQCPDCSPTLTCSAVPKCQDCACLGSQRAGPTVEPQLPCSYWLPFLSGVLFGIAFASIIAVVFALRRRRSSHLAVTGSPSQPPSVQQAISVPETTLSAEIGTAELARAQLQTIASRRRHVSTT